MKYIEKLDGLRAVLAWWVVVAHAMQWAGIQFSQVPGIFKFLYLGIIPVYGFMVLSGFVITHLLEGKKEKYLEFIIRRYFRLAPLLVVCMVVGFFIEIVLPQTNFFPEDRILLRILSHLSLLFGAFPNEIFSGEAVSFINPAWSISLEWQFYLVAPVILMALKGNKLGLIFLSILLVISICIGYNLDARQFEIFGRVFTYTKPSFLLSALPYFIFGMLLRLLWPKVKKIEGNIYLFSIFMMTALFLDVRDDTFLRWQIPPMIAFIVYTILVSDNLIAKIFESKVMIFLGRVSYSTYLLHYIAVAILSIYLRKYVGSGWPLFWAIMAIGTPLTIIASYLSFRFIETPGSGIGSKLSRRIGKPE